MPITVPESGGEASRAPSAEIACFQARSHVRTRPEVDVRNAHVARASGIARTSVISVRQVRFLIPVLPIASVLVMVAFDRWRSRAAGVVVAAALMFGVVLGIRPTLAREPWVYWSGSESRQAYLERQCQAT